MTNTAAAITPPSQPLSIVREDKGAIGFDEAGAERADNDNALLKGVLSIDTGTTFFAHGTVLMDRAGAKARRHRAEFLKLPTVETGMASLIDAVQAEDRRDHTVKLGEGYVNLSGKLCGWRDRDGASIVDLVPSETGWQRLASFAPSGVKTGLRTNVNTWLPRRREDDAVLRTRKGAGDDRELFAVVSTGYVPFDLDAIAACVAERMPSDARCRVRYDGGRARIDVVLHNPHRFGPRGDAGTVGELHRLALRITTADDGTAGFQLTWMAERIRCINLTILKGKNTMFAARHTREDLAEMVETALAAQGEVAESFSARWRTAWTEYYVDQGSKQKLEADEVLKRIAYHGTVRIPGIRGAAATYEALRAAWDTEPGDSRAAIHNAITRAAHEAPTTWRASAWADDETEEQASQLLYAKNLVLDLPEDKREQLGW